MKSIIITEKPSVAKDLIDVLSKNLNENFAIKKGYYEGTDYIVSYAVGHLMTLGYPEQQNPEWKQYKLDDLPMIPNPWKLYPIESTREQYKTVLHLIAREDVSMIINCGDAAIEGEGIQMELYETAFAQMGHRKPIKRMWVNSMTEKEIMEAFHHLRSEEEMKNLYTAYLCRQQADWLYGMNISCFLSIIYHAQGIAEGRVMTAVLGMVYRRNDEIKHFISRPYFLVEAEFSNAKGNLFSLKLYDENGQKQIFDKRDAAEQACRQLMGKSGQVTQYITKRKHQAPPKLYNLSELQKDMLTIYHIQSDRTLEIMQGLYEKHKIVTYPRTDSNYITESAIPDMQEFLIAIQEKTDNAGNLSQMAQFVIQEGNIKNIVNNKKVTDHSGITINGNYAAYDLSVLSLEESMVLSLIIRRMIIAVSPDYVYDSTQLSIQVDENIFTGKAATPIDQGYRYIRQLLLKGKEEESASGDTFPVLKMGEEVHIRQLQVIEGKTKPPAYYTEASLIDAMDKAGSYLEDKTLKNDIKQGIGTSATRAEILKKLISTKQYLARLEGKGKSLPTIIVTEEGERVYHVSPPQLLNVDMTAYLQQKLKEVESGTCSYDEFMDLTIQTIQDTISNYEMKDVVFPQQQSLEPSEKQKQLAQNISKTLHVALPKENTKFAYMAFIKEYMDAYSSSNNKVYANHDSLGICPICKKADVVESKDKKRYYCTGYKDGCQFSVYKEDFGFIKLTGKRISPVVMKSFLKSGVFKGIIPHWNVSKNKKGYYSHNYEMKQ